MSKFTFKQKLTTLMLAVLGAILVPAAIALAGWGPGRPSFTWNSPPNYITFNSFTNNPVAGDERPFFSGKVSSAPGNVVDLIQVNDNDQLTLRVYFHNNAAANLNLVAKNTKVRISLPKTPSTYTWSSAYISADNANPGIVSDSVDLAGSQPFTVEYIPGSAILQNNVFPNGTPLSDSIVSTGALVGYNAIDGNVPGCEQFSGWVTIKIKVKMQSIVTPAYACTLLDVKAQPNRKVDAAVNYTTSGGATFKNVTFDWGDGSTPLLTTNTSASYTYAKDGTYSVKATVKFDVSGTEQAATSVECSKQVTFTTPVTPPVVQPPAKLPVTGPGSPAAALFVGVSAFASIFHYLWSGRKFDL